MAHFLYRLNGPRPSFPADMTEIEGLLMQSHAAYWHGLTAEGTALLFGPVFDPAGAWGLAIIEAADESAARAIARKDPVIDASAGFSFDLFPMQIGAIRGSTETAT